MISICVILISVATAALAKGSTECDFTERAGAQQCFGAVGQPLIFHLPNTANTDISMKKDDTYVILKTMKNKIATLHEEYVTQQELFTNGTIKLGNAMKRHTGSYLLEEFKYDGVLLKKVHMDLKIQAPVSKPAVSQMCVSPELTNISCSSEGDEVGFMLTLNGLLLVQTRCYGQLSSCSTANMESLTESKTELDTSNVSHITFSLHGQQTGNLTCQVWNNVSREEEVYHLESCKDFLPSFHFVTVAVTATVVKDFNPSFPVVPAIVVSLLLVVVCIGIFATVTEGKTEDEMIYTSVIYTKNTKESGLNLDLNAIKTSPTSG